jgi:hypothetical protein
LGEEGIVITSVPSFPVIEKAVRVPAAATADASRGSVLDAPAEQCVQNVES